MDFAEVNPDSIYFSWYWYLRELAKLPYRIRLGKATLDFLGWPCMCWCVKDVASLWRLPTDHVEAHLRSSNFVIVKVVWNVGEMRRLPKRRQKRVRVATFDELCRLFRRLRPQHPHLSKFDSVFLFRRDAEDYSDLTVETVRKSKCVL